ncbi:MAG: thioredoxin domain-containing protein [Bacteroidetes bacterium]|nr:thioredoxin domain-containing protein [Bacteroidota bacterium]
MKNKLPFLTVLMMFTYLTGFSQNRSITFIDKPWSELLEQSKVQNKLIFLDAYTSWCGPCKWMAANMFTKDSIADYYNSTFICAHFDMEKGEGLQLAQFYQVKAYPTLLFINGAGEMVHKRVGVPQKTEDYLEMGKTALTPGEGFSAYVKKFQEGNRDPQFIMNYLDRLQGAYMPINEPLQQYFASQKESDLSNQVNWEIFYRYETDMDAKEFVYVVQHQGEFEKLYTKKTVNIKITNVFLQSLTSYTKSRSFTEENYAKLKQKIRDSGFSEADKVIFSSDLNLYQVKSDMPKFIDLACSGFDKYYGSDYLMLNRMAYSFFQIATEKKHLEKAVEWAKKSIELRSTAENNDTYANLKFKLGEKSEAVKYEQAAIELAKKERLSPKQYEDNLKKFQE